MMSTLTGALALLLAIVSDAQAVDGGSHDGSSAVQVTAARQACRHVVGA